MAFSGSGGGKILICLGFVVVASSFCNCTSLTRLKALDTLKENSTRSQGQAKGSGLRHGRLFIGQNSAQRVKLKGIRTTKKTLHYDTDYQADMGWIQPEQAKGQGMGLIRPKADTAAVERLLKLEPKVECTGDSMKLQVQDAVSTHGSLLFVDRGSQLSPLPLSQLPPSCGYTIRSTRRDFALVAPYDGCFVVLEENSYVLPLRWCGIPVRMSCPLMRPSSPNPPMVTCHSEGMVVKTEWTIPVAKIKVNLNGNWEPLMKASPKCGFSVVVHPEGVVISAHFAPCLENKDGMYTLELTGDGETQISCPSLSPTQLEPTKSPPKNPEKQTGAPSKGRHHPTQSVVPQVPVFPKIPEIPNQKPNQGSKDVHQLPYYPIPYPNFFYPNPDIKLTPTVQPPASPLTKKTNGPQLQETVLPSNPPVTPEGQVPQPFFHFYPWQPQPGVPVEKEPAVQSPTTQPPNGKVENLFYPYPYYFKPPNPDPFSVQRPELKPIPTSTPAIQITQGQKQPYYPYPFKPAIPPTQPPVTKPQPGKLDEYVLPNPDNPPSGPPQKPAPVGYQLFYPYFYPQPMPENKPAEKPQHKPSYPQQTKIPGAGTHGAKTPIEKPGQSEHPQVVKPPDNQAQYPYNPKQPQYPQPITLPPASPTHPSKKVTNAEPANVGVGPQPGSPLYCPQFCLPGFINCCPQIAFHQHMHHIIPAGHAKDSPVYPSLPLVPSLAYSGFDSRLAAVPPPQVPTVATMQSSTISTSAPMWQPLPPETEKHPYLLPPDGDQAPPSVYRNPTNQKLPTYPYFIPNAHYPYLPQKEKLQNVPQIYYNAPSKPEASVNSPGNPAVQYKPYYIQPPEQQLSHLLPGDINNAALQNLMTYIGQYQQEHIANLQNEPTASQTHPKVQSVPYPILQDAPPPINSSQPFVSGSKKPKQEETLQPNSESRSYVLLQHGPPGWEPSSFNEDLLPFRDQVDKTTLLSQNIKTSARSLNPPEETPQHAKWLGKSPNPLHANVNNMPRPGDESESWPSLGSATDRSHFVPLPQEPFSAAHINPEFLESLQAMWKPIEPQGSNRKIPARVPGKVIQQQGSAADHQMD